MIMSKNKNLHNAKVAKNDEFYTQLSDIEKELNHYKEHFKGKVVYCNCDDCYESNFFKYFALNFRHLGLKKLITTCYSPSPVAHKEVNLFNFDDTVEEKENVSKAYKIEIEEKDIPITDGWNLQNVAELTQKHVTLLEGDGDFRSDECIKLLEESDIVVTNPPFSLFREYVAQLVEYGKKFLVIGNKNAITYKEIFPFIKENKLWLGYNAPDNFIMPNGNITKQVNGLCRWYTNMEIKKRHEELILYRYYNENDYPKYDNYDAINVDKVTDIPVDYDDIMGVPITFLDKHNPNQFEIIGLSDADSPLKTKSYGDYIGYKQDGSKTGRTGATFGACPVLIKDDHKTVYYEKNGVRIQATYCRIFIKRIK